MLYLMGSLQPVHESHPPREAPLLILGGYSYGSHIASCLPDQDLLVSLLTDVVTGCGSSLGEIKARAIKAGRDISAYFDMLKNGSLGRGRSSLRAPGGDLSPTKRGVAMGGYDSEAASRRISRESSRKSLDGDTVRRSLDRARQRIRGRVSSEQHTRMPDASPIVDEADYESPSHEPARPQTAYLLISPVLPPMTTLITMFSRPNFEHRDPNTGRTIKDHSSKDDKFLKHPACIIYGDKDVFTSSRRVHKWAEELHNQARSTFTSYGVEGAGHFWIEDGAVGQLQSCLDQWLTRWTSRKSSVAET
jgi:pimeloyl-ACP methyl ester carboxylesterase